MFRNVHCFSLMSSLILTVVHFNQLWGTACTQKLFKILFQSLFNLFCWFYTFFCDILSKNKFYTYQLITYYQPVSYLLIIHSIPVDTTYNSSQHPKAGWNTQQLTSNKWNNNALKWYSYDLLKKSFKNIFTSVGFDIEFLY